MKRVIVLSLIVVFIIVLAGCAANVHTIGKGPQKGEFLEQRQWYAIWGLVPINKVDSKAMAGGSVDYEIKTEASPVDIIINIFTSYVTITSRTVTVTR
jgi:hypothetical protein